MEEVLMTVPGSVPQGFHGLLDTLRAYLLLLKVVVGEACLHYLEVKRLRRTLAAMKATYINMPQRQVAIVLWAVFVDARAFFKVNGFCQGESNLNILNANVRIQKIDDGQTSFPPELMAAAPDEGLGSTRMQRADTMGELYPKARSGKRGAAGAAAGTSPSKRVKGPGGVNLYHAPNVKMAIGPWMAAYPGTKELDILTNAGLRMGDSPFSRGSCLDWGLLGECTFAECGYK
jgi:hypothetical protein